MSLAIPKKKKIVRVIIILSGLVEVLLDANVNDSAQEALWWNLAAARVVITGFDDNDANWSSEQWAVWNIVEAIHAAHAPEAVSTPTEQNYADWSADLDAALSQV